MKVLVISDIHGNRTAFEAVLASGVDFDAVWNLGDLVGYGPNPGWCVDKVIELRAVPSLSGNHDLACIGRIETAEFNPIAQIATRWTATQLTDNHRQYLSSLPAKSLWGNVTLAHGSPRHPVWEYIDDPTTANENFTYFETGTCLVGHTHVASIAELAPGTSRAAMSRWHAGQSVHLGSGRFIFNPGSVGQPRDGDPRAAFALLDLDAGIITAHRVPYDIGTEQDCFRAAGLPIQLARRIAMGR